MTQDIDNPEWTQRDLKKARPARDVLPGLIGKERAETLMKRRGRPLKEDSKQQITVRLDPDIIAYFKGMGKGYHSKINQALKDWISHQ